jgi:hypothetical protein
MSNRLITIVVVAVVFYIIGIKFPATGQMVLAKVGL